MAMLMAAIHGDLPGQRVMSLGTKLANIGAPKSAGQSGGQSQGSNPNLSLAQFGNVLKGGGGEAAAAGEAGGAAVAGEAAGAAGAAEGLGSLAALAAI